VETGANPHPDLSVQVSGSNVIVAVDASAMYMALTFRFLLQIYFDGGQSIMGDTVYSLVVHCGVDSSSIYFNGHPLGKSDTQFMNINVNDPFILPTMVSTLEENHPETNCGVSSAQISNSDTTVVPNS